MEDMEIQNGGRLTGRESQAALFVNEGRIADVFGPGLYTLTTRNLPVLTDLMNWDKDFESPFKSDVYFFSVRQRLDQKWGTATPITIRDKEFGAVRLRGYGIYSYRIADPRAFYTNVSGTRDTFCVSDLEGQLGATIVAKMTDIFAPSGCPVRERLPGTIIPVVISDAFRLRIVLVLTEITGQANGIILCVREAVIEIPIACF
jgi:membrane protease subunit (stomatin/prohibitin family)